MGTLSTETQQLAEAVRLACIELRTKINGNDPTLNALNTTAKGSLVAAINEVLALAGEGGGSGAWDDITGKPAAITGTTASFTAALASKLDGIEAGATGDQDLSGLLTIATAASTYAPKDDPAFSGNALFTDLQSTGLALLHEVSADGLISANAGIQGNGELLTNLNGSSIISGNIPAARIATALTAPGPIGATTPAAISGTTGTFGGAVSSGAVLLSTGTTTYDGTLAIYPSARFSANGYSDAVVVGQGANGQGQIRLKSANPLTINATTGLSSAGFVDFATARSTFTNSGSDGLGSLRAKARAGHTVAVFDVVNSADAAVFGVTKEGNLTASGNLTCSTAGNGLQIKGGSALARAGNATLVAGTVTIANTTVTANTVIILTRKTSGGTIGMAVTYTVSAGASFTITSDSALDTSTYSFLLIEVNP